jgi:ketosteroid isomerase-like protein
MTAHPADIARQYFDAWRTQDAASLRSILTDDVTFVGPMGTADNAEEYVDSLMGLAKITTDIVVHEIFVDGDDVVSWFDVHTTQGVLSPVANWSRLSDGKIAQVRVTFDPRPLTDPRPS